MASAHQRGQAAVEGVGVTVLVALLLAALATWAAREVRPPARPPDLIGLAATPLVRDRAAFEWSYPLPHRFEIPRGRDGEPIGRALRAAARGVVRAAVIYGENQQAFATGFAERLRERGARFLDDPMGDIATLPDPDVLTPDGALRRALERADRLWAYARELRSMPLREAALKAHEDAGRLAADAAIEVGEAYLRRRVARGARGAPPAPSPPPPEADR